MTEQVQLRRGTAAQIAVATPAQGELWADTTNNCIVLGDGSTVGAWPVAMLGVAQTFTAKQAISDTTVSTSTTTGALTVGGGLGVAGNGYFGGLLGVPYGNNIMVGNNTPTAPITITPQTGTLPTPSTNAAIHIIGPNGTVGGAIFVDTFGINAAWTMRRADGALGSPAAVGSNVFLGGVAFSAYNGSAYSNNNALFTATTLGLQSGTNFGVGFQYSTTPQGSTTRAQSFAVGAGVVIGPASIQTSDPGGGCVAASGTIATGSYTVGTLPAPGSAARQAFASNGRMYNGTGTLEGAGVGTGGVVTDNGTAWKIAGTNQTVQA